MTDKDESTTWKKIHDITNHMNWSHCAEHTKYQFIGLHDNANAGLGRGVWDPKNYEWFVDEINTAYDFWIKQGRSLIKH